MGREKEINKHTVCARASQKCKVDEEVGATVVGARRLYICYQCTSNRERKGERVVLSQKREWRWHQQRNCYWYKQA